MSNNSKGFCQYLPSNKRKPKPTKKGRKSRPSKTPAPSFLSAPPSSTPTASSRSKGGARRSSKPRSGKTSSASSTRSERPRKTGWWRAGASKMKIDARDYNIFHIDSKIRDKLSANISTVKELECDLTKTLWILKNGDDPAQKVLAKHQASLLRKRIQDLESTLELTFYIFRTADLLEEYRTLIKSAGARSFVSVEPAKYDTNTARMNELVSQYLCIAQDYVELENLSRRPKKLVCPACQGIDFHLSIDDDSIYICSTCSTEVEILDDAPSFKDTDRVNMASKYTYTRKGHFIDAVKRFQGTQNTDPKKIQDAVVVVEEEMEKHNLISDQGQKNSVSKDHIYGFLSERGLSNHYDDLNLIFHIVTGDDCPNISEFVDDLLEDFDKLEEVLEEIKDDDRINSLSVNYKLYKLLQRRGYPCRKDDFYILKTKTKEDEHDEKMKEAWNILGWNWIPTF